MFAGSDLMIGRSYLSVTVAVDRLNFGSLLLQTLWQAWPPSCAVSVVLLGLLSRSVTSSTTLQPTGCVSPAALMATMESVLKSWDELGPTEGWQGRSPQGAQLP